MAEYIILTDENDRFVGMMEKLLVHKLGLLHRAFSVFIFNSKGEILLQQRAYDKYHSAGLWSNTCCSHPRFQEEISDAVERRLSEEMGIQTRTNFAFSFIYKVEMENGLTEHEYDHVYVGVADDLPLVNRSEVNDWKYMSPAALEIDIEKHPLRYTEWMKLCLPRVIQHVSTSILKISSKDHEYVSI